MCDKHSNEENCFAYVDSGLPRVRLNCVVNGEQVSAMIDPAMTLLNFLRNQLKLFGTKEGCGEGECGACTIIMNGQAVNSCIVLAVEVEGAEIITVEGLSTDGKLSILQQEFINHDALQCGFCTPGMLMSARSLLDRNQDPSVDEIKEAIAGNFCRCTGYVTIIEAIASAAKLEREARGK
ncbi:(2Fe-2S)-binding protein [Sporomusa sp.]|uniref:(2Fe-2S)-binding protein n=1 Tax=Sporomusa sp. TaxID=2078658 RepID=UPI002D0B044C|nr:(2Fe-2S)-binding protein [Sporomusa sp.]HWR45970.1 (2Fe-2S)-binding protein [Sporomusa sp.]